MKRITRALRKKEVAPASSVGGTLKALLHQAVPSGCVRRRRHVGCGDSCEVMQDAVSVGCKRSQRAASPRCSLAPARVQNGASEVALSDGSMTAIEAAEDAECRAMWGVSLEQVCPLGAVSLGGTPTPLRLAGAHWC